MLWQIGHHRQKVLVIAASRAIASPIPDAAPGTTATRSIVAPSFRPASACVSEDAIMDQLRRGVQ
ncbi:MAG TPA: hypothetical protein DEP35_11660 [Deltaproteobacteria bacterium]|nr:hypothetical protein [Deltaproteobacteria bacterium]